ncbi:MAG: hypothetical protein Kow00129_08780 [Thermoleophilia bacterium]
MTGEGDGMERLGSLLDEAGLEVPRDVAQLQEAWLAATGEEISRNACPRSFKRGRLVVATSSSVWAQTLQLMSGQIRERLNGRLREAPVREIVFRPAGWDPGGGLGGPRPLGGPPGLEGHGESKHHRPAERELSREEEAAVERVMATACDPELGRRIAEAMKASLRRSKGA